MHEEGGSIKEEKMWSQIYNEAGSTGEKRMKEAWRNKKCRGGKIESKRGKIKRRKTGQGEHQIKSKGNAGDVFSLPFIFPQCHPDYISATC